MKKSTFFNLIIGVVGGLLFALGMCLLPQWNALRIGVVCTSIGFIALLVRSVVVWIRSGRKIKINWKLASKVLYGVFAALVLGVGICMILVWNLRSPASWLVLWASFCC